MLTRMLVGCALAVALVIPGTAQAISPSDYKNSSKFCKALRADMGEASFKLTFGTNEDRSNAHGKCVSKHLTVWNDVHTFAVKDCRAERDTIGAEAFAAKYGTGKKGANAFGKCVSETRQQELEDERNDVENAARQCKAERKSMGVEAFRNEHGTNRNKRNAFGKCVSKKVKAENEQEAATTT